MRRSCDWCGQPYTARRPDTSRFCSTTCRKRNFRAPRPPDISKATNGKVKAARKPKVDGALAGMIRAELEYLGLDATTPGVLVLDLAERIEAPNTTDSSRAPMARELMRLREQLLRSAVDELDPLHVLQQRRQTKMTEEA